MDITMLEKRFRIWGEMISLTTEHVTALVWGGRVISLTNGTHTSTFTESEFRISPLFLLLLSNNEAEGVQVKERERVRFLPNGEGEVRAFFLLGEVDNQKLYFILLRGTARDKMITLTKPELKRRIELAFRMCEKIKV